MGKYFKNLILLTLGILVIIVTGTIGEGLGEFFNNRNEDYTKSEIISKAIDEIESTFSLPTQIDEVTIMEKVTAHPNAIRYHSTLVNVNNINLSNEIFKDYLKLNLCKNQDTRYLLNKGINMEYSYSVKESSQSYFVRITENDC